VLGCWRCQPYRRELGLKKGGGSIVSFLLEDSHAIENVRISAGVTPPGRWSWVKVWIGEG
jgi:hypothetical protein